MKEYIDFKENIDEIKLKEIANLIKSGEIVVFPTETVYGIGTNCFNTDSVRKIYEIKQRDFSKPISLLISDIKMVEEVAENISKLEYALMEAFFPGPFTIVLKKKSSVPDIVTAGKDTVGIRMPEGEIVQKLLKYAEVPIATPSANISGKPSGIEIDEILKDFEGKVNYFIDGGKSKLGISSTIVQVIDGRPKILRKGIITEEDINKVVKRVNESIF